MRPSRSGHVSLPTPSIVVELPLADLPGYDYDLGGYTASVTKQGVPEPTAWKIAVYDGQLEWFYDEALPGGKRPLTDAEIEDLADEVYDTVTTGSNALTWQSFALSGHFSSCRVRYAVENVWTHYGPCFES